MLGPMNGLVRKSLSLGHLIRLLYSNVKRERDRIKAETLGSVD